MGSPELREACVHAHMHGAEVYQAGVALAESNSNSLTPTEMQASLNPFEVNGEVPKDVNED